MKSSLVVKVWSQVLKVKKLSKPKLLIVDPPPPPGSTVLILNPSWVNTVDRQPPYTDFNFVFFNILISYLMSCSEICDRKSKWRELWNFTKWNYFWIYDFFKAYFYLWIPNKWWIINWAHLSNGISCKTLILSSTQSFIHLWHFHSSVNYPNGNQA